MTEPAFKVENKYPAGTYKHDFIEIWNNRIATIEGVLHIAEVFAEATEAAMIASIHGNVYEEQNDDRRIGRSAEEPQTTDNAAEASPTPDTKTED